MSSPPSPQSRPASPHSVTPALRKQLDAAFERGRLLSSRDKNYDYAHEMFTLCVVRDPGNLSYAESLLQNLNAKLHAAPKRPASRSSVVSELKTAMSRNEWGNVFQFGAAQLHRNPWHVPTLRALAEACAKLHLNEVELVYLKQALDADAKCPDTNRHCAQSLARMGQFDQAIACWHRVEKLVPGDNEAARMISRLSQEKIEVALGIRTLADGSEKVPSSPDPTAQQSEGSQDSDTPSAPDTALTSGVESASPRPAPPERLDTAPQKPAKPAPRKKRRPRKPWSVPWLEGLLVLSGLALVVQLVPGMDAEVIRFWNRHGTVTMYAGQAFALIGLLAYKLRG